MITWHIGLFVAMTLGQIGVQGRKQVRSTGITRQDQYCNVQELEPGEAQNGRGKACMSAQKKAMLCGAVCSQGYW